MCPLFSPFQIHFCLCQCLRRGCLTRPPDTHPRLICFVAMTTTSYVSNCQARSRFGARCRLASQTHLRAKRNIPSKDHDARSVAGVVRSLFISRGTEVIEPSGCFTEFANRWRSATVTARTDFCSCPSDHRAGAVPTSLCINVIVFLVSLTFYLKNYALLNVILMLC